MIYGINTFIRCGIWQPVKFLSGATLFDCINIIHKFIKPFLDNRMPIFEEYGAFKLHPYTKTASLLTINLFRPADQNIACANIVDPDEPARNEPSHLHIQFSVLLFFVCFVSVNWNPNSYQWTSPNSRMEQSTSETHGWKGSSCISVAIS